MPASHSPPFFPPAQGQIPGDVRSTCTACAGTLLLEFGVLSRLTGNATYEALARHAVEAIYGMRSARGLVGNTLDCDSGEWVRTDAGVGAGVDSFYEYLLKVCVCPQGEDAVAGRMCMFLFFFLVCPVASVAAVVVSLCAVKSCGCLNPAVTHASWPPFLPACLPACPCRPTWRLGTPDTFKCLSRCMPQPWPTCSWTRSGMATSGEPCEPCEPCEPAGGVAGRVGGG